jgi:hypothetical protein
MVFMLLTSSSSVVLTDSDSVTVAALAIGSKSHRVCTRYSTRPHRPWYRAAAARRTTQRHALVEEGGLG